MSQISALSPNPAAAPLFGHRTVIRKFSSAIAELTGKGFQEAGIVTRQHGRSTHTGLKLTHPKKGIQVILPTRSGSEALSRRESYNVNLAGKLANQPHTQGRIFDMLG